MQRRQGGDPIGVNTSEDKRGVLTSSHYVESHLSARDKNHKTVALSSELWATAPGPAMCSSPAQPPRQSLHPLPLS